MKLLLLLLLLQYSYFRKFVKYWNAGDLPIVYYNGVEAPATQTSYKWSFSGPEVSKPSKHSPSPISRSKNTYSHGSSRVVGPAMPTVTDRQLLREQEEERAAVQLQLAKSRERQEKKDRIEDQIGPKEVGRAGQLEKKRAQRESNKAAADAKDDAGLEINDRDLMGGSDNFHDMSVIPSFFPDSLNGDKLGLRGEMQIGRNSRRRRDMIETKSLQKGRIGGWP